MEKTENKITLLIHPFDCAKNSSYKMELAPSLHLYKQGVDFAANGSLVVLRVSKLDEYIEEERELYAHIFSKMPKEQVHFFPSLGTKDSEFRLDHPRGDIEVQLHKQFLLTRFSTAELLRDANAYAFGEALCACVPANASDFYKDNKLKKPVKILAKYSLASSVKEAREDVALFFSADIFDPSDNATDWDSRSMSHLDVIWDEVTKGE